MDGIAIVIAAWLSLNAVVVLLAILRAARRERRIRAPAAERVTAAETRPRLARMLRRRASGIEAPARTRAPS